MSSEQEKINYRQEENAKSEASLLEKKAAAKREHLKRVEEISPEKYAATQENIRRREANEPLLPPTLYTIGEGDDIEEDLTNMIRKQREMLAEENVRRAEKGLWPIKEVKDKKDLRSTQERIKDIVSNLASFKHFSKEELKSLFPGAPIASRPDERGRITPSAGEMLYVLADEKNLLDQQEKNRKEVDRLKRELDGLIRDHDIQEGLPVDYQASRDVAHEDDAEEAAALARWQEAIDKKFFFAECLRQRANIIAIKKDFFEKIKLT